MCRQGLTSGASADCKSALSCHHSLAVARSPRPSPKSVKSSAAYRKMRRTHLRVFDVRSRGERALDRKEKSPRIRFGDTFLRALAVENRPICRAKIGGSFALRTVKILPTNRHPDVSRTPLRLHPKWTSAKIWRTLGNSIFAKKSAQPGVHWRRIPPAKTAVSDDNRRKGSA